MSALFEEAEAHEEEMAKQGDKVGFFEKIRVDPSKSRQLKESVQKLQEQDASIFQYDEVITTERPAVIERITRGGMTERAAAKERPKAQYMDRLLQHTTHRKMEQDLMYQRRIRREAEEEAHLYGDKEVFVTAAYKQRLLEDKEFERKMKEQEARDLFQDPKKAKFGTGFMNFHRNMLERGQASGSNVDAAEANARPDASNSVIVTAVEAAMKMREPEKTVENTVDLPTKSDPVDAAEPEPRRPSEDAAKPEPRRPSEDAAEPEPRRRPKVVKEEEPPAPPAKRNTEESVMSARERFLARKKQRLEEAEE